MIVYVHGGDRMSSQKEENFKRLAENRTNKIIDMLHLIVNIGSGYQIILRKPLGLRLLQIS